jgi:hypothetical protein
VRGFSKRGVSACSLLAGIHDGGQPRRFAVLAVAGPEKRNDATPKREYGGGEDRADNLGEEQTGARVDVAVGRLLARNGKTEDKD